MLFQFSFLMSTSHIFSHLIYGTLWLLIQKQSYQSSMIYTVTILDFTRAVAIFWASPVNPLTNFTSRAPLRTAALNKFLASGPAFRVSATWSEVLHRHHGGHVHIISNLWLYLRLLKMYNTTIQMSYYVHIYIWILYIYICIFIYI